MPECRSLDVKGNGHKTRIFFFYDSQKNVGKAIDRIGGKSFFVGKRSDCVISAINVSCAVNEVNGVCSSHFRIVTVSCFFGK